MSFMQFFYEKRFGGKFISQHNNPILPQGGVDISELKPKNSYLITFFLGTVLKKIITSAYT